MSIQIEKGIPISFKHTRPLCSKYPVERMEIGDSFVCENVSQAQTSRCVAKRRGIKTVSRKLDDGKFRVWRIE